MATLPFRAVIALAFDPVVQVGDWHIRIQTIALAAVVFLALLIAARIAGRTPASRAAELGDVAALDAAAARSVHLRRDDLIYLAIAALPGAVAGGRAGYVLLHLDYYSANPAAIVDPGQGAFQLSLAVVGGTLTAAVVASLLDVPIGRWLHALILPLLFALAGGKVAMAVGGEGQGVPWAGDWATSYLGAGPWLSLAPSVPSHPAQLYEALATAAVLVVLALLLAAGVFARRTGAAFLVGLALWAVARLVVAFTWRDPDVAGPLRMDQVLSIAIAVVTLGIVVAGELRERTRSGGGARARRPRFAPEPEGD